MMKTPLGHITSNHVGQYMAFGEFIKCTSNLSVTYAGQYMAFGEFYQEHLENVEDLLMSLEISLE